MRNVTRREFGSLAAGISAATLTRPVLGAVGRGADQDRLHDAAERRPRGQRQAGVPRPQALGRRRQRQGRAARTQGRARQLRRPEQRGSSAGALHQADRSRQSGPRRLELFDRADRAGDAGDHGPWHGLRHPARLGHQRRFPIRSHRERQPDRRQHAAGFRQGLLRGGDDRRPEAEDSGDRRPRQRLSAAFNEKRANAGKGGRRRNRLRQELSAVDRRLWADRPGDPGRKAGHRLFRLLPAPTPSACSKRYTRPSSRRPCSAAA